MRALVPLALAILLVVPPASAAPIDPSGPIGFVLRPDEDGATTLLLLVEDGPGGVVSTTPVRFQNMPPLEETGVYTRVYEGHEGAPSISAGIYLRADGETLRIPLAIVENAAHTSDASDDILETLALGFEAGTLALPYLEEILLAELYDNFGDVPREDRFSRYRDHPTTYVWTVHRAVPGAEIWSGAYLARTGSVETRPDGTVSSARADVEIGVATRAGSDTHRVAGAFVETAYAGELGAQGTRYTAGAVAGDTRAPIATLVLDDARSGGDLAVMPRDQETRASLGVHANGAFIPLLGLGTTQSTRPSQSGVDVERITAVGAYTPEGEFVPVAGARYRSDTGMLLDSLLALAREGPGGDDAGDFAIDVGGFPQGEYEPVAGLVHRERFREMHHAHASFVGVGAYTPLGFSPVAVVTYDGTQPLLPWAFAFLVGEADGDAWMLAAGTMAAGSYLPLVGIGTVGAAPLQQRAEGHDVRAGVFAGSYHAFIPLASVSFDGDRPVVQHALDLLGGTLGADAGAFDVRVGTYATGGYTPLAGAGLRSHFDGSREHETLVVLGAYHEGAFVPLVGVLYQGDDHLVGSFDGLADPRDDDEARLYAGIFVQGAWTPLVMIENSGDGTRVTPLP